MFLNVSDWHEIIDKVLLYFCKGENTNSISRKCTCWEGQTQTPNETTLIF
jgi:hypothetical protein